MKRLCVRCGVTVTAETWTVSDWPCNVEGCEAHPHYYCASVSECATRAARKTKA